jgi:lipoprotein-anchoring transpeptidase ErfK/SrfK
MRILVRLWAALAALGGLAILSGCTSAASSSHQPAQLVVTSPAKATDVPTGTEIAFHAPEGGASSVKLVDAIGGTVAGAMRPDGSSWVPTEQLKWGTAYTATVTSGGTTKKVSFTTMKKPQPDNLVQVSTILDDKAVYGVAVPLVFTFSKPVPKDQRAAVERRLFVTSSPPQVGAWNWFSDTEVHYRAKDWWQPGTKLSVRVATGGLPLGGNAYGASDVTLHASIGDKLVMSVDDATHMMTVTQNDRVLKTIPVSLGKPSKPTSSGTMVVMTKNESELFVSNEPGDSYRATVFWTQRVTWGGQYIHAAPWSEGEQGRTNVSHGCTNVSTENAIWLYGLTHVGDPYVVKGTGARLDWADGWTDWNVSWDEYLKGSALPPPVLSAATPRRPSATPSHSN